MPGELDQNQIDDILRSESIGRIGCYLDGKTYIVLLKCSCQRRLDAATSFPPA